MVRRQGDPQAQPPFESGRPSSVELEGYLAPHPFVSLGKKKDFVATCMSSQNLEEPQKRAVVNAEAGGLAGTRKRYFLPPSKWLPSLSLNACM